MPTERDRQRPRAVAPAGGHPELALLWQICRVCGVFERSLGKGTVWPDGLN